MQPTELDYASVDDLLRELGKRSAGFVFISAGLLKEDGRDTLKMRTYGPQAVVDELGEFLISCWGREPDDTDTDPED